MAITVSNLTTGSNATDQTSYATASVAPTANKLVLLFVGNRRSGGSPTQPTVTGAGMTWDLVTSADGGNEVRTSIFRCLSASPSSGALTIDFAGVTQGSCGWSVAEFTGTDITGTNGSGAIVQTATNNNNTTNTGIVVTLGSFADVNNATAGMVYVRSSRAITVGSGFTQIGTSDAATESTITSEFLGSNDTSVDWSWASVATQATAHAVEIKSIVQEVKGGYFFTSY